MKPKNTDAQAKRRRDAVWSAVFATLLRLAVAAVALWVKAGAAAGSFSDRLMLVVLVLDLGMIVPVWINLKTRLKEIEGGEEDAAAQY